MTGVEDGSEPRPGIVPVTCEAGHQTWPERPVTYVRLRNKAVFGRSTRMKCGECWCGKPRVILPGRYTVGPDGFVVTGEVPQDGFG
jgi:hypothetical protein